MKHIIIWTTDNCPNCVKLKEDLKEKGIIYEERDANRLKIPIDSIDLDGLVEASMQNMVLPVSIKVDDL